MNQSPTSNNLATTYNAYTAGHRDQNSKKKKKKDLKQNKKDNKANMITNMIIDQETITGWDKTLLDWKKTKDEKPLFGIP